MAVVLLALYMIGAALEAAGILLVVRQVVLQRREARRSWHRVGEAEARAQGIQLQGVALLLAGVAVQLAANIASLYR